MLTKYAEGAKFHETGEGVYEITKQTDTERYSQPLLPRFHAKTHALNNCIPERDREREMDEGELFRF
jgi:hypothetical protein